MLSDGKDVIGWYFAQVPFTTPADYLSRTCMYNDGNLGTNAQLLTVSALQTDIYVANKVYRTQDSKVIDIRSSRIRASNINSKNHALYIANFSKHFEPVTRMINSQTSTFFFHDTHQLKSIKSLSIAEIVSHTNSSRYFRKPSK